MRQRRAVRVVQLPGHTPRIGATSRHAPREFHGGLVEEGDAAVGVGRVDRGRNRLDDFMQTAFAFAQRLFGLPALDQVGGLPRQDVQQPQVALRGRMRFAPVRGDHAQHFAAPRDERRRLRGMDAGVKQRGHAACAGEEITCLDVRRDRALAGAQDLTAGAVRIEAHPFPDFAALGGKSPRRQEAQLALRPAFGIEHLHGREVRPHDGGDGVDDFSVERVFITRLDELRADIPQQLRVGQFRGKLRLPRFLLLLELGDVAGKAARVNEFPVLEQHARIDQDMADRSVAVPQPGRTVTEDFAAAQAGEDIADDSPVGVKLGDVPPDILLSRVAEKIEFGLVRPKDGAVRRPPNEGRSSRFR